MVCVGAKSQHSMGRASCRDLFLNRVVLRMIVKTVYVLMCLSCGGSARGEHITAASPLGVFDTPEACTAQISKEQQRELDIYAEYHRQGDSEPMSCEQATIAVAPVAPTRIPDNPYSKQNLEGLAPQ